MKQSEGVADGYCRAELGRTPAFRRRKHKNSKVGDATVAAKPTRVSTTLSSAPDARSSERPNHRRCDLGAIRISEGSGRNTVRLRLWKRFHRDFVRDG